MGRLSPHVFPEAWCKQQGIPAARYNCLLNRTPLKKDTNRFIGSQPPSVYLARLVDEQGISKQRLNEILRSHSLEPQTLWNNDFDAFLECRVENLSLLIEKKMDMTSTNNKSLQKNIPLGTSVVGKTVLERVNLL